LSTPVVEEYFTTRQARGEKKSFLSFSSLCTQGEVSPASVLRGGVKWGFFLF